MNPNNDKLEEVLRPYINDLIKNMVLESKVEKYWDRHKAEEIVATWYWDNEKCEWRFKHDVIRAKIVKNLRPIIDKVMKENEDFINYFM
jgi:hypothetical protein